MISDTLKEASYQLRIREISKYPIFPISKDMLPIGSLLIARPEMFLDWNYNFSYLENFVELRLILEESVEAFQEAFKDPDEFCCLFVVDGGFTKFIFIPYPED